MHKLYFTAVLSMVILQFTFAQDTSLHRLTVASNILTDIVYEYNVSGEYKFSKRWAVGLGYGSVHPSGFNVMPLSPSQSEMPGAVYSGDAYKIYGKYYSRKQPRRYWCLTGIYRSLWYSDAHFEDLYRGEHYYANYVRSESAKTYSFEITRGKEYRKTGWLPYAEIFYGAGLHFRYRTYTTTEVRMYPSTAANNPALGIESANKVFPMLIVGIKLGLSCNTKKAGS